MTKPIRPFRRKGPVKKSADLDGMPDRHDEPQERGLVTRLPMRTVFPLKSIFVASFAAQLLGQPEQKRGLRAGVEVRDQARSLYLKTQWSGRFDRRWSRGGIAKTRI